MPEKRVRIARVGPQTLKLLLNGGKVPGLPDGCQVRDIHCEQERLAPCPTGCEKVGAEYLVDGKRCPTCYGTTGLVLAPIVCLLIHHPSFAAIPEGERFPVLGEFP